MHGKTTGKRSGSPGDCARVAFHDDPSSRRPMRILAIEPVKPPAIRERGEMLKKKIDEKLAVCAEVCRSDDHSHQRRSASAAVSHAMEERTLRRVSTNPHE